MHVSKGISWGILMALVLSFHELTAKFVSLTLPPVQMTSLISLLAGIFLFLGFPFVRAQHSPSPFAAMKKGELVKFFGICAFSSLAGFIPYYYGLQWGTVSETAMIVPLEVVFTALFGIWLFGEHLSRKQVAGVGISVLGAMAFTTGFHVQVTRAGLLVILAMAVWGYSNCLFRPFMARYHGWWVSAWRFLFGAVVVAPLTLFSWSSIDTQTFLWIMISAAVLGVGVAFLFQAMKYSASTATATMWYLPSVILSSTWGALVFGDRLSSIQYFAAIGILAGVWLVVRGEGSYRGTEA